MKKQAYLVLEDGRVFQGLGFGYAGLKTGEVVFNTSMMGYQEILTDPSYAGQIICMTYPHIGNYGINPHDVESQKIHASGFIVREESAVFSNYRAKQSIDAFLKAHRIPGICEIDTRALVRHIREKGAMSGVIASTSKWTLAELKKMAKKVPSMQGADFASQVSCQKPYFFKKGTQGFVKTPTNKKMASPRKTKKFNVVAYDFGVKKNILRLLNDHDCEVKVVPYTYDVDQILNSKTKVDGVFLSNGPGDPAACELAIANVKKLIGKKPLFGICLGHQILSLALGAKTYKLKFGHHGGNQPVMNLATKKVEITAQNHGFAVDPDSLPKDVEITHRHLNDQTVSGIAHKKLPIFSVQYHPEAAPGPHDSSYLFEKFVTLMSR